MTTPKELRGERLKAHAKMRDEVRNAVKEEMLREGIGREEIRQAVSEMLMGTVRKKVEGTDMRKLIQQVLREELTRMVGGNYIPDLIRKTLKDEAEKLAAAFIEKSVLVTTTDKEHW